MNEELSKVVAALVKRGKHRGFLTMAEVQQELEDAERPGKHSRRSPALSAPRG